MSEFPNISLVVMHSNMNINMDSNKRVHKQTNNKQTSMYAFETELKPFNLTEPSQANPCKSSPCHFICYRHKQMKWQGLDLHGFSYLLSQGYLILSMFIDFNE